MAAGDRAAIVGGSSTAPSKVKNPQEKSGLTFSLKKAGLEFFSIRRITKRLKNQNFAEDVCVFAPVYLTGVIEYLAAEVLEVSGNEAKSGDGKITSSHVDLAVKRDNELGPLFERVKFLTDGAADNVDSDEEDEFSDTDSYSYVTDEEEREEDDQITCECQLCVEDEESDTDENCPKSSEYEKGCAAPVVVGEMSVARNHMELYGHLVDEFGEIVTRNLPKYKVEATCVALNGLLNTVANMIDITPETVSIELVSEWEEMASFYASIGLKVEWLQNRVGRYRDWLSKKCSEVDLNELCDKLAAKQNELDTKREEVCILEKEVGELRAEVETGSLSQSQFGFSFFHG